MDMKDFDYIKTPEQWKLNVIEKAYSSQIDNVPSHNYQRWRKTLVAVVMVLLFVLMAGSTVLAYSYLTSGEIFKLFYKHEADTLDNSLYADIDILDELAGKEAGRIFEDDHLCIESLGSVSGGNMFQIMLLITVHELETVIIENNDLLQSDYTINDISFSQTNVDIISVSSRYVYSDTDLTLEDNQFKVVYSVMAQEPFESGGIDIFIDKIGYVRDGIFIPKYDRSWNFVVDININEDSYVSMSANTRFSYEMYDYLIDDIMITPFTCMITLSSEESYSEFDSLLYDNVMLTLIDGTQLSNSEGYTLITSSEEEKGAYIIEIYFTVPVSIDNIFSINILNSEVIIDTSK